MLSSVPLVELAWIVTKSFHVIFDGALESRVTRIGSSYELHSLEQEVMLVHIRHELKS